MLCFVLMNCKIHQTNKYNCAIVAVYEELLHDIDSELLIKDYCISPRLSMNDYLFNDMKNYFGLKIIKQTENLLLDFSPDYASRSCEIMKDEGGKIVFSPLLFKGKEYYIIYQIKSFGETIMAVQSFKTNSKCEILEMTDVGGTVLWQ